MKKIILFTATLTFSAYSAVAQISTPTQQIDISKASPIIDELVKQTEKLKVQKMLSDVNSIKSNEHELKAVNDSAAVTENKINQTTEKLSEILSQQDKFALYGNASLATSENISDINALTNILGVFNFHKRITGAIGFNIKGVQPATLEKDSVNLNTLMFPDAGNAGFLTSLSWNILPSLQCKNKKTDSKAPTGDKEPVKIGNENPEGSEKDYYVKNSLLIYGDFSFKQTNFSIDTRDSSNEITGTNKYSFSVLNYNLGLKYIWTYRPLDNPKNNVDVSAQVYGNFFNIPNEDNNSFSKLYNDTINISAIWSLGFKAVLSFRGVSVFGDFRANLNTNQYDNANVFKGFVFNVGTRFSTEILGF